MEPRFTARSSSHAAGRAASRASTPRRPDHGRPGSGRPGQQRASRLELAVDASGLYRVTAGEIANLVGVTSGKILEAIDSGKVRLTSQGESVSWARAGEALVFYGERTASIYAAENVYRLELGAGATMGGGWAGEPVAGTTTTSMASQDFEENLFPMTLTASADADLYYWAYLSAGDPTWGSFTTSFTVANQESGDGSLELRFQSATSTPALDEHRVRVELNGFDLGTLVWDGMAAHVGVVTVPSGVLQSGPNTLELTAELGAGVPYSVMLMDGFALSYPRLHRAVDDRLLVTAEAWGTVSVEGFAGPDVLVADVTDAKHPVWLSGVTVTADGAHFRATFASEAEHTYAMSTATALVAPGIVGREPTMLRQTAGAEYVVIAPQALLAGAQALADYRTSTGLSTMVVELDEIYTEFSDGLSTPEAIEDFLAYAWSEWPVAPRFVALAGDGTFDYQDHQGLGDNLVPPRLVATPQGMFASDVMLGDVAGDDGRPEIAVGRIPVTTDQELVDYVAKLSAYEGAGVGAGVERLTMLADNADPAGNFPLDSDTLLVTVPETVTSERIYLSELPVGTARTETFSAFAAGTDWVNYMGHGGIDRFANEGLLLATDAAALAVGDRLPVVSSLTCSAGRFEVPGWESLAEALVLAPNGGATVVWAPSGQSYH
ncbi:MAG: hypothetical protein KJN71_07960, partial [Acidimicrobiia bacterium]|nr:hypothetical protein [Acidimicrobiia bacterium]